MNKDVIYLPEKTIRTAAEKFPTPFFLYDEKRLRDNAKRFKNAFRKHFKNFVPLYAVKANSNPHVIKIIVEEGYGFDASSEFESYLAKTIGATGMYTGNYNPVEELRAAKKSGMILNLDDISMIPTLKKIGVPETLSFRINPGIGKGGAEKLVFGGPDAKYGIPFEHAAEAYKQAKKLGVKHFGIHMMTGSNVMEEVYFGEIVTKLLNVVADIKKKTGIEIEFMNMGGGFGVPYRPEQKSLDIEKVARIVKQAFDTVCKKTGIKAPRLMAEPGRYLTADAGWLVGRVQVIKDGYKKFVGVDAGSNDLPRPATYGAYHHATLIPVGHKAGTKTELVSVVGRICENSDQLARDRKLPLVKVGDLIAIHNAGGHSYVMGHNYNGRMRSAEILIQKNGKLKKIRRAETFKDLLATVL